MRTRGSTFISGCPSVASRRAIWRATSQLTGPCWLNSLARSPKIGSCSNGFPDGPSSAMKGMVGPVLNVSVIGSGTSLGRAVAGRLQDSGARVTPGTRDAEVVVCVENEGVASVESTRALLRSVGGQRVVYTSGAMVDGAV